jgi:TM2 domain-containing membrane protein YozV
MTQYYRNHLKSNSIKNGMDHFTPGMQSTKNYAVAVIFAAVFGIFGIHYFYIGRTAIGLVDLSLSVVAFMCLIQGMILHAVFLFFIDMLHSIYATYKLFTGQEYDGDGKLITYPGQI